MMDKILKIVNVVALVAIAIAFVFFGGRSGVAFGAVSTTCQGFTSCLNDLYATTQFGGTGSIQTDGTMKVSSTGTAISRINTGQCFIQPYATTIAASSTAKVDCQGTAAVGSTNIANDTPLAGVTAGDNVVADLATSTAGTTLSGLDISAASASTTSGYIQLYIVNQTGTTFTWPTTGTASGTASYIVSH